LAVRPRWKSCARPNVKNRAVVCLFLRQQERFISTLRRECLDHVNVIHAVQLRRLIHSFLDY
jgi:hypothetical protein